MSLRVYVLSLLYIFGFRNSAKGLILTPSKEAAVLCEGEELELICTSNDTFLQWSWSLQIEPGKVLEYSRFISSTDASQQVDSFSVNSTSFHISRVSHQGRLPLVSRLLISPASLKVNAVIIANCTEVQADGVASITINMVGDINANYPNLPEVNSSVIEYGILDVTVRLQWIPLNDVFYNISTNPKVATVDLMTPSVQFSVSYNTHYKVSIIATSSCGQNRTVVSLHYAACEYPLQEGNSDANYTRPALEGTSVMFNCPPGLEVAGSESATCMENGEWEPNITCSRPLTTANSKDTDTDNVNSGCCGLSGDLKIAISTLITAFVIGSILFFITGFLCRHFCQKGKTETVREVQGLTYYGNVVIQKQEQELELNENVAYGPIQV